MSKIQWTDKTQNPINEAGGGHYCVPISPGCKNCYASRMNKTPYFGGNGKAFGVRPEGHPEMTLNREMLATWARMRKPKKHFVGSMTDVFGEWVPDWMVLKLFDAMAAAPLQTFQVLTKRPERLPGIIDKFLWWTSQQMPKNVWLGTSAEDQKCLDQRLIHLIRSRVRVRFLSLEPLLGPIRLFDVDDFTSQMLATLPIGVHKFPAADYIDWVIIGGESGPGARAMSLDWVRDILEQCREASIPAFLKQLGSDWARRNNASHSKGGDPTEWPADFRVRMFPGEVWE